MGLSNNATYEISTLLAAADQLAAQGTTKLNAQNAALNALFSAVNTAGGIG